MISHTPRTMNLGNGLHMETALVLIHRINSLFEYSNVLKTKQAKDYRCLA